MEVRYAVAGKDCATFLGVHGTGAEETRPAPCIVWHYESFEHSLKSGLTLKTVYVKYSKTVRVSFFLMCFIFFNVFHFL